MSVLVRLGRWLMGTKSPEPMPTICDYCERGHHVHDVNSDDNRCITTWCRCGVTR